MQNIYNEKEHLKANEISRRKMLAALGIATGSAIVAPLAGNAAIYTSPQPNNNFSLNGKAAIVTGAARGIGRAIAVALADAGADIMGIDIAAPASTETTYTPATKKDLDDTAKLVQAKQRRFIGVVADIRDMNAMNNAAAKAIKEFGKIDILIANAAIQTYMPVAQMNQKQWTDVIDVNINGTFNSVRAVVNQMITQKSGRIIMISSGQGRHGFKEASSYSASKWAIIGFMKSLALELAEDNITVNTVEPGLVDTPLTRNAGRWNLALKDAGEPPQDNPKEEDVIAARLKTQSVQKIPWMQPEDVAPAVVFLCTDAAYRVTGATYDATAGDSAKYTA